MYISFVRSGVGTVKVIGWVAASGVIESPVNGGFGCTGAFKERHRTQARICYTVANIGKSRYR